MTTIYSIGHSNKTLFEFIKILKFYKIELVVDVRSLPGSRKFPRFNKENLLVSLLDEKIEYYHHSGLGGMRKVKKDSKNNLWHNSSFRGYADYMESEEFSKAIDSFMVMVSGKTVVIMCAEALWWRCHRAMISDYLKSKDIEVMHIMAVGVTKPHTYTSPARIIKDQLFYYDSNQSDS